MKNHQHWRYDALLHTFVNQYCAMVHRNTVRLVRMRLIALPPHATILISISQYVALTQHTNMLPSNNNKRSA